MAENITLPAGPLAALCQHYHIRRLSLFGSVLRSDFRPDSDVDVLVVFEQGEEPGFLKLYAIEQELSALLGGRRVDLVTENALNHRIYDRVLAEAELQYGEG